MTKKTNSKITWKQYIVSTTAPDKTLLTGIIHYWAKDYKICMTEPFQKQGCSGHLQYGIPVVYVTDEVKQKNVIQIDLCDIAKEVT